MSEHNCKYVQYLEEKNKLYLNSSFLQSLSFVSFIE